MVEFIESNSCHYTMYNDSVYKKLESNIVGAGSGAKAGGVTAKPASGPLFG